MVSPRTTLLKKTLAQLAPGTELRDGLERILQGRTGALIVLGYDRTVEAIGTGGFDIAIDFTGTRLRELAKMDGAIICDRDVTRILRAGIHLMPDPSIPTEESGTRHRTAERVARQTGFPVVSVSKSMGIITIYVDGERYPLEGSQAIMARANQAIQTLERYTERLEQEFANLSALEIESDVTVRNVAATLQRLELVRRITEEIDQSVMELGVDGRMISMQLEELVLNRPDADTVLMDYLPVEPTAAALAEARGALAALDPVELADPATVARSVGLVGNGDLEHSIAPRGHRLLAGISSIPRVVADRLVDRFDGLQALMAANLEDLKAVEGIGEQRARNIRESLARMAESSLLERFM
ncbi:DNA integrity scanning diadenylate cyclase DisA [Rothia sp. AR01]|uniref:DNA integrity scanning protein DisA n=1 Tax=Rothia santali TaxID=2949643 RepID=A0A9X2KIS8_9MICC|nr:DNA integrity scanning diadenylate cyclase DisA [Rothia santali]MCP3426144.1 DNA integrity scanning diadenylate cyclase DisA [Rothia santali]